jgi:5-(carboxyamino)imidazole ribonucleotide synthase
MAIPPGSTIGILGGGQLGRMLALAAARLGLRAHVYTDEPGPALDVAAAHTVAPYDRTEALDAFARQIAVAAFEFENIPADTVRHVAETVPVRPGAAALAVTQDRLAEKRLARSLGAMTADFAEVDCRDALWAALDGIEPPAILKTRRLGYDGKGQVRIREHAEADAAWLTIGKQPAILERVVPFDLEASVVGVRSMDGSFLAYDVVRNVHRDHILHTSTVPSGLSAATEQEAVRTARAIADALDYVGVLAVELFVIEGTRRPKLYVNEIAPRVHNSGHWTIDACGVCQFENHVRAVAGWPLGPTARHSDAVMTNLIGREANAWSRLAGDSGACLHLYGKDEARPGRKMGHVTRLAPRTPR